MIIYHLPPIKWTRNSYWENAPHKHTLRTCIWIVFFNSGHFWTPENPTNHTTCVGGYTFWHLQPRTKGLFVGPCNCKTWTFIKKYIVYQGHWTYLLKHNDGHFAWACEKIMGSPYEKVYSLAGSGQDPKNLQKSQVFMDPWWNNQKNDQINDKSTTILGIRQNFRNLWAISNPSCPVIRPFLGVISLHL